MAAYSANLQLSKLPLLSRKSNCALKYEFFDANSKGRAAMSQRIKWACALVICSFVGNVAAMGQTLPNQFPFPNGSGLLETYNANGKPIDLTGPFFQSLGTNGRSCASCHRPAESWSVSAEELKIRFELTQGLDPFFRPYDSSNCSHDLDTSTVDGRLQGLQSTDQQTLDPNRVTRA